MVSKKSLCLLGMLVLHSLFSHLSFAQNDAKQFTQVIEWEYVDYAMHYEIVLEKNTALNEWVVYDTFDVTTNSLELTLNAGEYRYNVTVYNIFGRAEQTSDWYNVTIKQALQPIVNDIFPKELELSPDGIDESSTIIALNPKDVSEEASFFLKGSSEDETLYGDFVGYDENGMMQIEFETEQLNSGEYELIIQDPSGLTSEDVSPPSLVNVDRTKPFFFNFSMGYSSALFPQIENGLFSDYDFPSKNITLRLKASYASLISPSAGFFGFEFSAYMLNNNFTSTFRDVTGFIFPVTINAVYHKPLGEKFVLATHLGAGATFLNGFIEHNSLTEVPHAAGIAVNGGIAGQYFFSDSFFVELGADYIYSYFLDTNSFHMILPTLSLGWRPNKKAVPTPNLVKEEPKTESDSIKKANALSYINISAGYTYALFPPVENTLFGHFDFPSKNVSGRVKLSYIPFVSTTIGSLGFEVSSFVLSNTFEAENSEFSGFSVPTTFNIAYHKPIAEKLVLAVHMGAGLNFLLNFNDTITGATMQDAAAIAFTGGIAGQYFVTNNFFVELGVDYIYSHIIDNTSFHTALPTLSVGWKVN